MFRKQDGIEKSKPLTENFVRELTSLFGPIEQKQDWLNTYRFSNDEEIYPKLVQLDANISRHKVSDKSTTAILIGNGYLLSILPLIAADTILLCDISHDLLNWMQFLISSYLACDNEKDFLDILTNDQSPYHNTAGPYVKLELKNEKEQLKEYYYFDENYIKRCKSALASKKIVYVPMDFSDHLHMEKLKDCLIKYDKKINFMNLTNVWQWIVSNGETYKSYKDSLVSLPYDESLHLLYSSNCGRYTGQYPTCRSMCHTIKEYIYSNAAYEEDDIIKHDCQLLEMKEEPQPTSTVPVASTINDSIVVPSISKQLLSGIITNPTVKKESMEGENQSSKSTLTYNT